MQKRDWKIARILSLMSEREWDLVPKRCGLRRMDSSAIVTGEKMGKQGHSCKQVGKCASDESLVLLLVFFQSSTKQGLQLQVRLGKKG